MTKSIALDLIKQGIRCNSISPGTISTPSLDERLAALPDSHEARRQFIDRAPRTMRESSGSRRQRVMQGCGEADLTTNLFGVEAVPTRDGERPSGLIDEPVMVISLANYSSSSRASMCAPIAVGCRNSKGAPATGRTSPVGTRVGSTGVNRRSWYFLPYVCPRETSPLPLR
jgi:hypothetical protein